MYSVNRAFGKRANMIPERQRRAICSQVARILREERLRRGFSLADVSERTGLSYQMVGFVEKEMRNPTLETLLRLCDALELDSADLLTRAQRAARSTSNMSKRG